MPAKECVCKRAVDKSKLHLTENYLYGVRIERVRVIKHEVHRASNFDHLFQVALENMSYAYNFH